MTSEPRRAIVAKSVKKLYDRRREQGLCIRDAREHGGPPHEAPTRNKRRSDGGFDYCQACYDAKLKSKRRASRGDAG